MIGNKIRILFITPFYYPATFFGGPTISIWKLSGYLAKAGYRVDVYTTDAFSKESRIKGKLFWQEGKLRVFYFKNLSNWLAWKYNLFLPLGFVLALLINIKRFDLIYLHDFYTFQNIVASLFCRLLAKPYFLQPRGSLIPSSKRGRVFVKKIFLFLFGKFIINGASRVIALSQKEANQFVSFGINRDRIFILPNGVDFERFRISSSDRRKFRKKYGIPERAFVIIFVGRIHKVKGLDSLIKAYWLIKPKIRKSLFLLIVGPDAGYKSTLEGLIYKMNVKDNVVFTGILTGKEKGLAFFLLIYLFSPLKTSRLVM